MLILGQWELPQRLWLCSGRVCSLHMYTLFIFMFSAKFGVTGVQQWPAAGSGTAACSPQNSPRNHHIPLSDWQVHFRYGEYCGGIVGMSVFLFVVVLFCPHYVGVILIMWLVVWYRGILIMWLVIWYLFFWAWAFLAPSFNWKFIGFLYTWIKMKTSLSVCCCKLSWMQVSVRMSVCQSVNHEL